MERYVRLYAMLKVDKKFIAKNIKVKDFDFKKFLYKSTSEFVPLNDLTYYFWFNRKQIDKSVVDTIFSNLLLSYELQEEQTNFPLKVDISISSDSFLISGFIRNLLSVRKLLKEEDKEILDEHLNYFDSPNGKSLQCYSMPIKNFKLFIEDYLRMYKIRRLDYAKRPFAARLIIKYK